MCLLSDLALIIVVGLNSSYLFTALFHCNLLWGLFSDLMSFGEKNYTISKGISESLVFFGGCILEDLLYTLHVLHLRVYDW